MKATSVPGTRASAAASSASTSCAANAVTADATPRCVTGMPAEPGTAAIDETPGTTSNGTPALRERERLLAAAAEHERVAALQAHDAPAAPAVRDEQLVHVVLREAVARDAQRVGGASATSSSATSRS